MMILSEQIGPFHNLSQLKEMSLDFSDTVAAFGNFLSHITKIFSIHNNALLDLFLNGIPTIKENEIDCKRDIHVQLEQACENFIVHSYELSMSPIVNFLRKINKPTDSKDFVSLTEIKSLIESSLFSVPESLSMILSHLSLYLENTHAEHILFNPIISNIFTALQKISCYIEDHFSQETASDLLRSIALLRFNITKVEVRNQTKNLNEYHSE